MATTGKSTTEAWGSGENETISLTDLGNYTTVTPSWNVTSVTSVTSNVSSPLSTTVWNLSTKLPGLSTFKLDPSTIAPSAASAIAQPSAEAYTDSGLRIFAGVLMIFITVLALIGNVGVMIGLRHKCFYDRALYTFLNNLAITMLCDCLFNAPFIIGAMLSDGTMWLDASFLCPVTSFVGNFIQTQIIMSLMLLVIDRMLSLKYSDNYITKTVGVRANLISGYTWIHSMAFTLAIVVTSVESDYFQDRYLCSVVYKNNLAYNVIYSLLCNIAPWVTMMCCYVYIVALASVTNARDNVLAEAGYGELTEPVGTASELNHAKPVGILIFLWCVLIGPFHILGMIYVYSGVTMLPGAVWTIFTCLRFIFDFLVAVAILIAWPESWKECKHFITCRRDNAITENGLRNGIAIPGVRSSWAEGSDGSVTDRSTLDRSTLSRSFNVPVLFPTPNGLQLQVSSRGSRDSGDIEVADYASEEKFRSTIRPPAYLPPLFSVVQSSEEDSFNTNSSMPLKGEDNELFDLNESADSKTAISQFQLSLGKGEDFHALKSTTPGSNIQTTPRDERESRKEYSPRYYQKYSQADSKTRPNYTSPVPQQGGRQKRNSSPREDYPSKESKHHSGKTQDNDLPGRVKRVSKNETVVTNTSSPTKEQNQSKSDLRERSKKGSITGANNIDTTTAEKASQDGADDGGGSPIRGAEKSVATGDKGGGSGGAGGGRGGRRVSGASNGEGGVGRGLRSREETEKRQRHSSGRSVNSNTPSPRDNGPSTKNQDSPDRAK